MTDREILERAADILERNGRDFTGPRLREVAAGWPPDPPTPPDGVEVRIAVAISPKGIVWAVGIDHLTTEKQAIKEAVGRSEGQHNAFIVAVTAPPVAVPVVAGTVIDSGSSEDNRQ